MAFQILIVEDSPTQALKLELLLNENRYLTFVAKNGRDGIDMARENIPDLIISDVTMPIMNGFQMCREIKDDDLIKHIPVLLLTDLHNPEDIIDGLNAKADAYVTKPYKESYLLSKIDSMLSHMSDSQNQYETKDRTPIEIVFSGKKYTITAGRTQILNLLMSTYENSLLQNTDLKNKQLELNLLNEELKRNNSALTASEDRFRSLVLTIPDIVYRIDKKGHFTFINNAIKRLGYEKEELIGKHFSEIIYPADIDSVSRDKVLSKIPKNVRRQPPKLFDERRSGNRITTGLEVRLRSKTGDFSSKGEIESLTNDFVFVEVNSAGVTGINTISDEKEHVGTVGVIRDISERKKAEEALERERLFLQSVVDSVPVPIFFKTIHGEYQLTNVAFCDFFNEKTSNIIGNNLFDFLPIQVAESFHFQEQLFLNNDDFKHIYEMEIPAPDKKVKNVICHTAKFFNPDQSLQGLIGVIIDVSSQKKIEFELHKSRIAAEQLAKRADEANRLKSDFLANMSHEIRTPMNAIIGLNALALKTEVTPRQKDYLQKIDQSAQSLLGILNDILDFSKIEAHKLDLESVPFKLSDILENLNNMFCMKQDEKQIELIFSVENVVPNQLIGDPLRLGQVFINLVNNAIKFTESGEILISVSVDYMTTHNARLVFSVQDTGIGMTEEQQKLLFQPFSQADSSTTRKYGGTGLGLTISKRLVEMMNGKIHLNSIYGEGSTFSFTGKFKIDSTQDSTRLSDQITKGKQIFIVDDNETFRNVLYYLLTNLKTKVNFFSSGEECIHYFQNEIQKHNFPKVDLILMDYHLPGKNGLETAIDLNHLFSENTIPIILMDTIYGREQTNHEISEQNIKDVIVKPIASSVLYKCLKSVFQPLEKLQKTISSEDEKSDDSRMNFKGIKILLAEDNLINQQVAYELLSMEGIHVTIVDNGQKAVQNIEETINHSLPVYDAILMDIQMPEMDGYEATQKINALFAEKQRKRPFPIIAMTAHAMSGDRDRCIQAGMDDYISKPIQPNQVFSVLSKWVSQDRRSFSQDTPKTPAKASVDPEELLKDIKYLDIKDGVNRLGGRIKLYHSILQEFCSTHAEYPDLIENSIQDESFLRVHELAHTLKGVAGNLSAYELLDVASKVEKFAKQKDKQSCLNCFPDLEKAFENVVEDANILKNILKSSPISDLPQFKEPVYSELEDKGTIKSNMINLLQCLNNNDLSANTLCYQLMKLLENSCHQNHMEDLLFSIERLDFEQAKTILLEIAKKLSIVIEV